IVLRCYIADVADKAGVVRIVARTSDGYDVAGRTHVGPGQNSYGDIVAASTVYKRRKTNGRVLMTGCVVLERINTNGRVALARGVALKCAATDGRFIGGCCVVQKGSTTDCCVVAPTFRSARQSQSVRPWAWRDNLGLGRKWGQQH